MRLPWRRHRCPDPVFVAWPFGPDPAMRNTLICERLSDHQVRVTWADPFGTRHILLDSTQEELTS